MTGETPKGAMRAGVSATTSSATTSN